MKTMEQRLIQLQALLGVIYGDSVEVTATMTYYITGILQSEGYTINAQAVIDINAAVTSMVGRN